MADNDNFIIPNEILNEANAATFHLLPDKSKGRYLKELEKFRHWMKSKNVSTVTEEVVVAYFNGLIGKYAPPSLWSTYSMLRSTLFIYEKVDISKFKTLFAIIKSKSKGYEPKKAKTFERKDVEKFMKDAPDEEFLLMKVVVLMGVMGACRCDELVNLKTTDINDNGSILVIKIEKTKNYKPRSFVVTDAKGTGFNGMQIYRKYAALRPLSLGDGRFFLCYRSGKCTVQPVGINTLSKIPKLVANYLNLNDAHLYTGHCFRRTSATFLANASADILTLKRHGGWRSSSVAESYVEESVSNKVEIAKKIINSEAEEGASSSKKIHVEATERTVEATEINQMSLAGMYSLSNPIFNNCTVNFHVNK